MLVLTLLLTLLSSRSDRVKSCDLHPTEQWMLVSLYNGNVHIWNYESQQLVKSFEVRATTPLFLGILNPTILGLRPASQGGCICAKEELGCHRFWWHAGRFFREKCLLHLFSQIRIFNYNTLERQHAYEAHSDYVRSIAVHPTQVSSWSGKYMIGS